MSRSRRKAIYKDKGVRPYWRYVRSTIKSDIRNIMSLEDIESYRIRSPKEIIDDWKYEDFKINCEYRHGEYCRYKEKLRRK